MLNNFKIFIFSLFILSFFIFIDCKEAQTIQQINQCSKEEFFNINQLKCVKCEQTINHQMDDGLFSILYPKTFNQGFGSNLILSNQNFTTNSHLASTSSLASIQLHIQSNLERSDDGLSCVCKKGNFAFKKRDPKKVKIELDMMICLPCPQKMVSSLNRNSCSFCGMIPNSYLNNLNNVDNFNNNQLDNLNEDCVSCSDNEIMIERPLNSKELANLNRTALLSNYNYTLEFDWTHLDQILIRECVRCPIQTKSINNQCRACHFSFENCACPNENDLVIRNGVCVLKTILRFNEKLFKINYTLIQSTDDSFTSTSSYSNSIEQETDNNNENQLIHSSFIAANFHSSFSQCNHYHNITACEQFANFCVLNHYRFKPKTSQSNSNNEKLSITDLTTICDVYMEMNKQIQSDYLPQIYFRKDEGTKSFLIKTNTDIRFNLNERFRFYLIALNANGRLKESREFYLDELFMCSGKDQSMDSIVRFAVNVEFKCKIELARLFKNTPITAEDQLFYELYLLLNQTSLNQTSKLANHLVYPIYVLNRNLLKDDQLVNREGFTLDFFNYYMDHSNYYSETINRWQLVKRFFMTEQLSSKEFFSSKGSSIRSNEMNDQINRLNQAPLINEYGNILRYVSKMKLMIRTSPEKPNQIFPPILIIDYSQVTKQQLENQPDQIIKIEFSVHFESSELALYRRITIFLAILCSLIVLLSLFRTYAWSKRSNHDNTLNLSILFKFVLFNCDYLANVFFVLVMIISLHSFLIYKFQSVVYCFLPTKSLEHYIQLYLILAFTLKSISIVHEFYIRSNVDIFFIDWEREKSRSKFGSSSLDSKLSNSTNNLKNFSQTKSNETINNLQENDNLYKYLNQHGNLNGNATNQSANGSNDLQQKLMQNQKLDDSENFAKSSNLVNQFNRNAKFMEYPDGVSIWRTLFVANEYSELSSYRRVSISYHLFILLILLQCFGIENFARADLNLTLDLKENQKNVANSFTSRFVVGGLTFLITVLINYIFTRYYLEQFVCDKISEFVDFCSVSNVSIFCLMFEKFGYYVHGRNPTGRSEVNIKEMYQNLLLEEEDLCSKRGLLSNSDIQCFQMFLNDKIVINYRKIRALLKQKTQNVQKIWYSYYLMNKLLSGFIEHMFIEMDYLVRERSFFEMLLDAEFHDVQLLDKSIFFPDKFHSFENVLFVGVELDVILFELMFFTLIDLLTFNYVAAISFTFILNQILEKIFYTISKKNLIRKSLVDERFLL